MKIKHIFFDLDHTLWDFEKNSALTFHQLFEEGEMALDVSAFLKVYSPINFDYWKRFREESVTKEELRYGRLRDTFVALNFSANDQLIHQLSEDYICYLPNYNHLFDGAIELLDYLETKYSLHIITNGFEEVQHLKLEKSGIREYFDKIITSESVGVKKPNPKIFNHALSLVKANSEECLMVGDNLEADIIGALDCNIESIHFNLNNEIYKRKNYNSVSSLLEIKQYL